MAYGRSWALEEWLYYQVSIEAARFLFGVDPRPERTIDSRTGRSDPAGSFGAPIAIHIDSMARITDEGRARGFGGDALGALIEEILIPMGRVTDRWILTAGFNEQSRKAFRHVTDHPPHGAHNVTMNTRSRGWRAEVAR